jgi:hypothetical protein
VTSPLRRDQVRKRHVHRKVALLGSDPSVQKHEDPPVGQLIELVRHKAHLVERLAEFCKPFPDAVVAMPSPGNR